MAATSAGAAARIAKPASAGDEGRGVRSHGADSVIGRAQRARFALAAAPQPVRSRSAVAAPTADSRTRRLQCRDERRALSPAPPRAQHLRRGARPAPAPSRLGRPGARPRRPADRSSCCTAGWTSPHRSSSSSTRFAEERHVIALDWRGFGAERHAGRPTPTSFPTTSATSRSSSTRCSAASARRSTCSATAWAATWPCSTPASGRSSVRRLVNLEGFGMPRIEAVAGAGPDRASGSTS